MDDEQRRLWEAALRAKGARVGDRRDTGQHDTGQHDAVHARGDAHGQLRSQQGKQSSGKGIGPNKACGHKGGICRQGSKRG